MASKRVNKLPLGLNPNLATYMKKKVGTPAKGESQSKHTNPAASNDDTARRIADAYAQSQTKQAQNRNAPKKNSNIQPVGVSKPSSTGKTPVGTAKPSSGNNIVPVKKAYKKEEDARKEIETAIANGTAKKAETPTMKQDTAGLVRRSAAKTTAKATAKKDDATGKTTSSNDIDGPVAKTLRPRKTTTKKAESPSKSTKPVTTKGRVGSTNNQRKKEMEKRINPPKDTPSTSGGKLKTKSFTSSKKNVSNPKFKDTNSTSKNNPKNKDISNKKSAKGTKKDSAKKDIKKAFDAVAVMKERRAKAMQGRKPFNAVEAMKQRRAIAMKNRDPKKNPKNINLRGIVKKGKR